MNWWSLRLFSLPVPFLGAFSLSPHVTLVKILSVCFHRWRSKYGRWNWYVDIWCYVLESRLPEYLQRRRVLASYLARERRWHFFESVPWHSFLEAPRTSQALGWRLSPLALDGNGIGANGETDQYASVLAIEQVFHVWAAGSLRCSKTRTLQ